MIPGNDDAARAIALYCDLVSRAALDGMTAPDGDRRRRSRIAGGKAPSKEALAPEAAAEAPAEAETPVETEVPAENAGRKADHEAGSAPRARAIPET